MVGDFQVKQSLTGIIAALCDAAKLSYPELDETLSDLSTCGSLCYSRTRMPIHFTVSLRVLDDQERALLIEHPKLGIKTYPGGHIDAGEDPCQAVLREASEEVGIKATDLSWLRGPVAIGLHSIPHTGNQAEHFHADLLYEAGLDSARCEGKFSGEEGIRHYWCNDSDLVQSYLPNSPAAVVCTMNLLHSMPDNLQ